MPALFQHHAHAELPGKHCRRRKARTVFSDSQLSGLEKRFEIQRYLSTPERVELATALSLSETQVRGSRDWLWHLSPPLIPSSVPTSQGASSHPTHSASPGALPASPHPLQHPHIHHIQHPSPFNFYYLFFPLLFPIFLPFSLLFPR